MCHGLFLLFFCLGEYILFFDKNIYLISKVNQQKNPVGYVALQHLYGNIFFICMVIAIRLGGEAILFYYF
ncbi:TPA: hypothetical protein DCZ39_07920 [Patescibacteria group bacterium]|nr:hypothetical protein [Candidatus Gracilibacteria bacterium]